MVLILLVLNPRKVKYKTNFYECWKYLVL
jgi:hypothetical protein